MFAPSSAPWACEHILSGMVPADLKGENNPMGKAGEVMKEGKQEGDKDAAAASTKVGRHIQVVFEEADILKRSRGDICLVQKNKQKVCGDGGGFWIP